MIRPPTSSTLFPYTTLFRSEIPQRPLVGRGAGAEGAVSGPVKERRSAGRRRAGGRSEEHTSELQSQFHLVCRLPLEKKQKNPSGIDATNRAPHPRSSLRI